MNNSSRTTAVYALNSFDFEEVMMLLSACSCRLITTASPLFTRHLTLSPNPGGEAASLAVSGSQGQESGKDRKDVIHAGQ